MTTLGLLSPRLPLLLFSPLLACSLFAGATDTGTSQPGPQSSAPEGVEDKIRADERAQRSANTDVADADQAEQEAQAALRLTLGQAPAGQTQPPVYRASETIQALRAAKIQLRIEPVKNKDGEVANPDLVMLHDSYTDRVAELQEKIVEQTISNREAKEIQTGSKYVLKLVSLKNQVLSLSLPATQSGMQVTQASLTTMLTTAAMGHTRRHLGMEWTSEDYEVVREKLVLRQRAASLAAISIGMLAAYQAVVDGADPEVLNVLAEESLKAFPLQPDVSLEDAKQYVELLEGDLEAIKEQHVAQLRAAYGDQTYESKHKARIDKMFDSVEAMMEAPSSEPAAGPGVAPDAGARRAGSGPRSRRSTAAKKRLLDTAADLVPEQVDAALAGVAALRNKDPVGALQAALLLVPVPGPARTGLTLASNLLKAAPRRKQRRRT